MLFGTVWGSVHLLCHGDETQDDLWSMLKEMEDVVINLRRRHRTSRIVIGSDLNVCLAPSREGLTGFGMGTVRRLVAGRLVTNFGYETSRREQSQAS